MPDEKLEQKRCVPCEGKISPMSAAQEQDYIKRIEGWKLVTEGTHRIKREFTFEDFVQAMGFVNKVADTAEEEGHHPDIYIYYNKVVLELHTHAVGGLFENDFIMAAKINTIR